MAATEAFLIDSQPESTSIDFLEGIQVCPLLQIIPLIPIFKDTFSFMAKLA